MKANDEMGDLLNKINLLKEKQKLDLQSLKEQFYETYESVKPINILKKNLHEVVSSSEVKADLLKVIVSLVTNYFSNKIFPQEKKNPMHKI
jgi:DUF438 domain-containing protein